MVSIGFVLAHQGGRDELLYFAVPVVLTILALRWAEKRATRRRTEEQENSTGNDERTDRR